MICLIEAKPSLIGFFDILGYGELLENCDIPSVVSLLENVIAKLPDTVKASIPKLYYGDAAVISMVHNLSFDLRWLFFSDSILVSMPVDEGHALEIKALLWTFFLIQATALSREMFDVGLPLRGALSFGDCYVDAARGFFAGKQIIEVHNQSRSCDWAGTILSTSGTNAFVRLLKEMEPSYRADFYGAKFSDMLYTLLPRLSVPFKTGANEAYALNWRFLFPEDFVIERPFKAEIEKSFRAHNKGFAGGAVGKAEKTEAFFKECHRLILSSPGADAFRQ